MKKRVLATFLVLCMVLGMLPGMAWAAESSLIQLATPTNLAWGMWAGVDGAEPGVPGEIFWQAAEPSQNRFRVSLYRDDNPDEPVYRVEFHGGSAEQSIIYCSHYWASDPSLPSLDSGTYYFTVQSLGDGTMYSDSEIAVSDSWTYTKPDAKLEPVTNPAWDWPGITSDPILDTANLYNRYEFYIYYYFSESGDISQLTPIGGDSARISSGSIELYTSDFLLNLISEYGDGYYYFKVRTLSNDITKYQCVDSELSDGFNVGNISGSIKDSLDSILNGSSEDIRDDVQALDPDDLKTAMHADTQNTGVIKQMEELEAKVGGPAAVTSDQGFNKIDPNDVSIVGANLNTTGDNRASLHFGDANIDDVIPEQYHNTVAFSMDLEGVTDTSSLPVPVKITLPIPPKINPDYLVILHYHQDGTMEALENNEIHVYSEDDKWYVSIVVTSFSDFVMAQNGGEEDGTVYTVTFNANGGMVAPATAATGTDGTLTALPTPTRDGYTFDGWYTTAEGGTRIDETAVYTEDTTLYAHWTAVDVPPVDPPIYEDTNYNYISITQPANGTITPTTRNAAPGERVTLYANPDNGYELDSLTVRDIRGRTISLRSLGGNAYSFLMPNARVTVEAKFTPVEAETSPAAPDNNEPFTGLGTPGISGIVLNPAAMPFTDVAANSWYYNSVDYVWKHYLMSGVSDTQFAPGITTSRAMIWTILARMSNVRTDINPGATWYERGQLWAMEQGVTDGTNPMSDITREQLAAMLWRRAGRPAPGTAADLSQFSDSGSVSEYAVTAVRWAVSVGILNGSDGRLEPQGTATRAQVAAMVMRYGEKAGA